MARSRTLNEHQVNEITNDLGRWEAQAWRDDGLDEWDMHLPFEGADAKTFHSRKDKGTSQRKSLQLKRYFHPSE